MIENIVAIELLRRGYELYAGVLYKKAASPQRGKRFLFATAVPEGQIGRR